MLRFPNPGSTISNFVEVYNAAFRQLNGQVFDLDSMVAAIVEENLATSSGYMGVEAISRSTRRDRSRDPLYNQLKMYAELFRALGWIHPTEQSALNFAFTLLGRQVAEAKQHYLQLMGETVLGISYPSHVLDIRGGQELRPFAFLLLTMLASDAALSRDEMIVGPLSADSDRSEDAVPRVAALVGTMRTDPKNIAAAMTRVAAEQNVQVNTLKNYTRWPIAVMRDLGWTEKARRPFLSGGRSFEVHQLTDAGRRVAEGVSASADMRLDQVDQLPFEEKTAVSVTRSLPDAGTRGVRPGTRQPKAQAAGTGSQPCPHPARGPTGASAALFSLPVTLYREHRRDFPSFRNRCANGGRESCRRRDGGRARLAGPSLCQT